MADPAPEDEVGLGAWRREPRTEVRHALAVPPDSLPTGVIRAEQHAAVVVPTEWAPHAHPMHELVWVHGGTLSARVGDRLVTIAEGHGLWLPAGVVHAGRLTAHVELRDAFFEPDRTPVSFVGPQVIAMTPVLESLLTHLARPDLDGAARARAEQVVFDVLEPVEHRLELPLPGDARIDPIAEALLDDPADDRGLEEWAEQLGVSDRTITRAFRASTGLSFVQWRRALRVHQAMTLLAEGWDVQRTSEQVGYAQPSTFIAAFRQVMGRTPGAYLAARPEPREVSGTPYRLS
jgi:AraC-like DNA-binding protein/mannose-6-phosphate isomerase-like protein (cupin superfamily)